MKTCKLSWVASLAVLLSSQTAAAQADGSFGNTGTTFLLESMALVVILACVLMTFKLYRAIRGGKIGIGWKWFLFGFSALGVSQLLLFGGHLGVVPIWNGGIWVDVLRIVSVILLLIGVTRFRKLLA
jgi:hypothetical protein